MLIYMVQCLSDMTEGRGPLIDVCAFLQQEDANKYIDHKPGVMGRTDKWSQRQYGDWRVTPITVYHSIKDRLSAEQEQLTQSALSKLSAAEKNALGL